MDKIKISSADLDPLFEWRDKHLDLVLRCPCPLKGVEIHVEPNSSEEPGFYMRCIREKPNRLRLYIGSEGSKSSGYFLLEHMPDGKWLKIKDTIDGGETKFKPSKKEFGDSLVALYGTLMAIMAYSSELDLPEPEAKERKAKKAPSKRPKKQSRGVGSGTTYILRRNGKSISVGHRGSHASPKGIFTVRGHWRHYKNGNIVWVTEYKKGTGKKKPKTYKVGSSGQCPC